MDTDSNKVTWVVIIVAAVAIMGGLFVKFLPDIDSQMQAYAQAVTGNLSGVDASSNSDFSYSAPNTDDDTISIVGFSHKGYVGHKENLIIPQYRKIGSVYYKITAISHGAFYENTSIKRVTIPDGVRTIGDDAFRHEPNLKYVTLGSGVTSIGGWAFQNTSLTSIDLPSGVTSIGDWAFQNTSITSIDLPAGVTSIGDGTFWGTKLTSIDLPASITSIGDRAFQNAPISAISFKHRVDLGELSFTGTKLANVTLPTGSTYKTDANRCTFDSNVKVTVK